MGRQRRRRAVHGGGDGKTRPDNLVYCGNGRHTIKSPGISGSDGGDWGVAVGTETGDALRALDCGLARSSSRVGATHMSLMEIKTHLLHL